MGDELGRVRGAVSDDLCSECHVKARRENGQGRRHRLCASCQWVRQKASPKQHERAKAINQKAGAIFRTTDKRRVALRRHALGALRGAPRAIYASLTPTEWQTLWRSAKGKCPICRCGLRNRYDPKSEGRTASCDHNHRVEKALLARGVPPLEALRRSIRGLLCGWCNHRVLPMLQDKVEMAHRAALYLKAVPAQKLLKHAAP
jgi:hypothetical protein